jgi:hypothetical protein
MASSSAAPAATPAAVASAPAPAPAFVHLTIPASAHPFLKATVGCSGHCTSQEDALAHAPSYKAWVNLCGSFTESQCPRSALESTLVFENIAVEVGYYPAAEGSEVGGLVDVRNFSAFIPFES